jgi:hypothetical protein
VSFIARDGVEHAVEVLADSLFEAAGLGLRLLTEASWVGQRPSPLTRIQVEVREPAVLHSLTVQQLRRWADGGASSPSERLRKERAKALLKSLPAR